MNWTSLDFDRNKKLGCIKGNHTSAIYKPSHLEAYISEELSFGAVLGPLDKQPFPMHISPFKNRDKSGSDRRRVIMDLSWPKGEEVNDGVNNNTYLGTQFQLHYPSVDDIVHKLNSLGPAAKIFKVGISRTFRHIRIDPGDIDLLGLHRNHSYYIDLLLPLCSD